MVEMYVIRMKSGYLKCKRLDLVELPITHKKVKYGSYVLVEDAEVWLWNLAEIRYVDMSPT